MTPSPIPWKVSLHGGHSSAYCDHAQDDLRAILDAAVAEGYSTFGVTEHVPRLGEKFLYDNERELGWTVKKIREDFERYAVDVQGIAAEYEGRLTVLKGFEIEVVPHENYAAIMKAYRERLPLEYIVGSVHFLRDRSVDGPLEEFSALVEEFGGIEPLSIAYYRSLGEMVATLRPEVVGHLDLIRKNASTQEAVETPAIRRAAEETLEVIAETGGILDFNLAGYRKNLGGPYLAPWILEIAVRMNVPVCFGDDSHCVAHVGAHYEEGRKYLLAHGIHEVCVLERQDGELVKAFRALG